MFITYYCYWGQSAPGVGLFLFHELAGYFRLFLFRKDETWYLPLYPHTFPFVISVVRLIEVACVVILRSKLHLLPHFDLNFGFLLRKYISIIFLSLGENPYRIFKGAISATPLFCFEINAKKYLITKRNS